MENEKCAYCKLVSTLADKINCYETIFECDNIVALKSKVGFDELRIEVYAKNHVNYSSEFELADKTPILSKDFQEAIKAAKQYILGQVGQSNISIFFAPNKHVEHLHCWVSFLPNIR